jgi:cytochrome c oxidase assembly factor CtaG
LIVRGLYIAWPFNPSVDIGLIALGALYGALGRRTHVTLGQVTYFGLGLATLWIALETPIDTVSDFYLDSVHMVQHVLLAFIAPPLLLLGLSAGMVSALVRLPGLRAITEPVPAQLIAGVTMIGWHIPMLYNATLYSEPLHITEHLMFIASGVILWWPIVSATSQQARWQLSPIGKLIYMLAATLPQDAVALAFQFSRTPFYDFYVHAPRLVESLTPVVDQGVAGAVLMVAGKLTFAIAAITVFARWFGTDLRADHRGAVDSPT